MMWWYENGQLFNLSVFGRMEKMEGEEMRWYKYGQLKSKCFWKDGKEEGEEMRWHENGQLEGKNVLGRMEN
jgi:uncharacterized protein